MSQFTPEELGISFDPDSIVSDYTSRSQKLYDLKNKKEEKVNRLSGYSNNTSDGYAPEYKQARLESLYDVDSPQFVGVTGGVGREGNDRTGLLSEDRLKGIDSYEVYPSNESTKNYFFNDPRGIRKLEKQRKRLAESRGVPFEQITNEDVFEEGAKGTLEEYALLAAYATKDPVAIENARNWEPPEGSTEYFRNNPLWLGDKEHPLNIPMERADLGENGWYGRKLTAVKPLGSEYLLGQEKAGYVYGDDAKNLTASTTKEEQIQSVLDAITKDRAENNTFFDNLLQVPSGAVSGFVRGAVNLVDAGQELATYVPQAIIREVTDDPKYDIDLLPDDIKEKAFKSVDELIGYDRDVAEYKIEKLKQAFKKANIDITSIDSLATIMSDPKNRELLGDEAWEIIKDPSISAAFLTEIIGAGGALKLGATLVSKLFTKVAPKFNSTVNSAMKTSETKTREALKAAKASGATADEIKTIQKSYTKSKAILDGLTKGGLYANADLATRMNEDITQFQKNNDGESPSAQKLLEMLMINRVLSSAEVGALKIEAGAVTQIAKESVKKGVGTALAKATYHIGKSIGVESVQETADGIAEQINQKLDSAKYKDYTLEELLRETSADILTSATIGGVSGGHIGAGSKMLPFTGELAQGVTSSISSLREGTGKVKDFAKEITTDLKDAFGGDEEIYNNLNNSGSTVEERQTTVNTATEAQVKAAQDVSDTVVQQIKEAFEISEDRELDQKDYDNFVSSLKEEGVKEIKAERNYTQEKLYVDAKEKINLISNIVGNLSLAGRHTEAQMASNSLLKVFKEYVTEYGSSPNSKSSKTMQDNAIKVISVASELGTLTNEDLNYIKSTVLNVIKDPIDKKDIEEKISTAIEIGNAYNTINNGNTLDEVTADTSVGKRGFLNYFHNYRQAIESGNNANAIVFREQLGRFSDILNTKKTNLKKAEDSARLNVEKAKSSIQSKNPNITNNELRAELISKFKDKKEKVDYGTGNEFTLKYTDIVDKVVKNGKGDPQGVYKVLEQLDIETEAMEVLLSNTDAKVVQKAQEKTKEPTKTESSSTINPSNTEEPLNTDINPSNTNIDSTTSLNTSINPSQEYNPNKPTNINMNPSESTNIGINPDEEASFDINPSDSNIENEDLNTNGSIINSIEPQIPTNNNEESTETPPNTEDVLNSLSGNSDNPIISSTDSYSINPEESAPEVTNNNPNIDAFDDAMTNAIDEEFDPNSYYINSPSTESNNIDEENNYSIDSNSNIDDINDAMSSAIANDNPNNNSNQTTNKPVETGVAKTMLQKRIEAIKNIEKESKDSIDKSWDKLPPQAKKMFGDMGELGNMEEKTLIELVKHIQNDVVSLSDPSNHKDNVSKTVIDNAIVAGGNLNAIINDNIKDCM